ncbi:MAG: hypothetical protein H5U30_16930, partial [Marinobacter sp.]|nr:hypothetical protein [Marinobacter sp.]
MTDMTDNGNTSAARETLARIIDTSSPATMLSCGALATEVSRIWQKHQEGVDVRTLDTTDPNASLRLDRVADLALITGTLEHLPHDEGALLLGQLRNYGTHQIAVLVGETPDWAFTDFIGLGFRRHAELENDNGALTLYTYNLDTYN